MEGRLGQGDRAGRPNSHRPRPRLSQRQLPAPSTSAAGVRGVSTPSHGTAYCHPGHRARKPKLGSAERSRNSLHLYLSRNTHKDVTRQKAKVAGATTDHTPALSSRRARARSPIPIAVGKVRAETRPVDSATGRIAEASSAVTPRPLRMTRSAHLRHLGSMSASSRGLNSEDVGSRRPTKLPTRTLTAATESPKFTDSGHPSSPPGDVASWTTPVVSTNPPTATIATVERVRRVMPHRCVTPRAPFQRINRLATQTT